MVYLDVFVFYDDFEISKEEEGFFIDLKLMYIRIVSSYYCKINICMIFIVICVFLFLVGVMMM